MTTHCKNCGSPLPQPNEDRWVLCRECNRLYVALIAEQHEALLTVMEASIEQLGGRSA
jgi:uncharacterized Zn finger protein (UPF0148 family)